MTPTTINRFKYNKRIWEYLSKTEENISTFHVPGVRPPKTTASVLEIQGKKIGGEEIFSYIFKDNQLNNLGSDTFYSDGFCKSIRITDSKFVSERKRVLDLFSNEGYVSSGIREIRSEKFLDSTLIESTKTMFEVIKKHFELESEKVFQTMIRVKKEHDMDGSAKVQQDVKQIESGDSSDTIWVKILGNLKKDGSFELKEITSSNSISFNTAKLFYPLLFLERTDILKALYSHITRQKSVADIAPELILYNNTTPNLSEWHKSIAGYAERSNTKIGINLNVNTSEGGPKDRTLVDLIQTLGHECEHAFTQYVNIQRSGLMNLKDKTPRSIKFYNEVMTRFGNLPKGSLEYKQAEEYCNDINEYVEKVYNKDGSINQKGHSSLASEIDANKAGEKLLYEFLSSIEVWEKNFDLLGEEFMFIG